MADAIKRASANSSDRSDALTMAMPAKTADLDRPEWPLAQKWSLI